MPEPVPDTVDENHIPLLWTVARESVLDLREAVISR